MASNLAYKLAKFDQALGDKLDQGSQALIDGFDKATFGIGSKFIDVVTYPSLLLARAFENSSIGQKLHNSPIGIGGRNKIIQEYESPKTTPL